MMVEFLLFSELVIIFNVKKMIDLYVQRESQSRFMDRLRVKILSYVLNWVYCILYILNVY